MSVSTKVLLTQRKIYAIVSKKIFLAQGRTIKMTFLELQNLIVQTRKSRRGITNRRDYFKDEEPEVERAYIQIYQKALKIANQVVNHYIDIGYFDQSEKISLTFGYQPLKADNRKDFEFQRLQEQLNILSSKLAEMKDNFRHGGRKGYGGDMIAEVKKARENGETWRGLAKRLGISTTTAQKMYQK